MIFPSDEDCGGPVRPPAHQWPAPRPTTRTERIAAFVLALVIGLVGAVLLGSFAACGSVEAFCLVKQ